MEWARIYSAGRCECHSSCACHNELETGAADDWHADIDELAFLTVTNTATVSNPSAVYLRTAKRPPGVSIDDNGVITWLPSETDGPGSYTITTEATSTYLLDQINPRLSATNSFGVNVNEVNIAPVLPLQSIQSVGELSLLTMNNAATDSDIPPNLLSYQLVNPPAGAVINSAGVITWTPTETQGPATYRITATVTDNGTPPLSATANFLVKWPR